VSPSAPPLLLGAAVLFWGWHTGLYLFALVLAPLLEGARVARWRLDISRRDVNRVSDLCVVVFAGMALYLFSTASGTRTTGGPRTLSLLFQWSPLALAPLVACQLYSTAGRIETSALFWTLRKRAGQPGAPPSTVDLSYPYVAACVFAASAVNVRGPWFSVGVCALTAWALWSRRSPRVPALVWGALLVAAAGMGYGGQIGLRVLQQEIEQAVIEYVFSLRGGDTDPFRSSTAIGSLGRLKLSDRVVLRVTPHESIRLPLLLREASYNVYNLESWYAVDAAFTRIPPEGDGETWKLESNLTRERQVTVSAYLKRGLGVLALPAGVFEINRLAVVRLSKNRLGAVKAEEGLGLVTYTALTNTGAALDAAPGPTDVRLAPREGRVVSALAEELGLASMPPARAVATVRAYFARGFRYSTWGRERRAAAGALEDFLRRSRAGHCEYFATATALLLRAGGVPARYAVGYSVQELSWLERAYVARARHAHSWALAYVDGRWIDVDTTPSVWADEERPSGTWEAFSDGWSWIVFQFSRWRWSESDGRARTYLIWLLVPLVLFLAWRIYARTRVGRRAPAAPAPAPAPAHPGEDSEFYAIERRLADTGLGRPRSEPAAAWVRRLRRADGLDEIVALHDRYRFDPAGISAHEREALRAKATAWLTAPAPESGV
jgi:transglutaminase-like putative cysteine protease